MTEMEKDLKEKTKHEINTETLWETLKQFEGEVFQTAKGLDYSYKIKGGELFVSRKDKSITRSTVELAYLRAKELGEDATGPKKLGVFGASYLYPVFVHLGVIPARNPSPDDWNVP